MSDEPDRTATVTGGERRPLSLFVRANRRIAVKRHTDGVNRPRFGPRVATVHYYVFARSVRATCRILQAHDPTRYTDADPLAIRWADPSSIQQISPGTGREYGSVVAGDWDRDCRPIDEDRCFRSMRQHFIERVPWEQTPLFRWFRARINSGDPSAWSYEAYKTRFAAVDKVYHRIKHEGYHSQRELFESNPGATLQGNNDCVHPYLNEVGVDIGRDGTLLWRSGGRHRLFIAKLLGIPAIPTKVWSRHRQWQHVRQYPAREAIPDEHPDWQDADSPVTASSQRGPDQV